ncbi:hypothetical protein EV643_102460 [Kribbella sp. VKM Ac-2527]|uniref:Uncharacterized protein n=1 Tax=Kribbella caucasensis TaxID=2512215 RepID=A0A4R6KMW7_9ACTN|nr:hypothetical protein [Kribbella sp. VKM Ac-2527]TDO52621.1 hypothetical protein EV643_102460 [Kribbella sp. VKM Ac-2527]
MKNLLDYDDDESILTALRLTPDTKLQSHIVTLLDLRNHASGWMAEQWQSVLLLAVRVRDERRQLSRAVDDATCPVTVRPLTDAELADGDTPSSSKDEIS